MGIVHAEYEKTLKGTVKMATASAEITASEKPEKYWVLVLDQPKSMTIQDDDSDGDAFVKNIRVVQLSYSGSKNIITKVVGKRIEMKVDHKIPCYHGISGHIYEEVTCLAESVRVIH